MTNYHTSRSTSVLDAPTTESTTIATSPWVRLGARLFAGSLDAKLAAGASPAASHVLLARSERIATPSFRRGLADQWLDLLIEVRRPRSLFDPAVPLVRSSVLAAEAQIHALAEALVAPLATVRGVAQAIAALRDGSSPLYTRGPVSLTRYAADITAHLSPLTALA